MIAFLNGRIDTIERIKNSTNGNPRFRITMLDGKALNTSPDAAFAYEVGNQGLRPGDLVVLAINDRGAIVNMLPRA